ncbi:MAG: murein DD-endopeptidase MepM/ murein hydrolase activator NlpD [Salibacteraceae bacterium]|jgi:murein DD-endopeptidase MepM/ murein hydrolase activator NlpD|tara:strand:- start:118 stop:1014 length:897 start_codon:yes stop_codon:yes gene_type:complete
MKKENSQGDKQSGKTKKVISKIKHKSRLVLMNDDTFEEQFSLILSPLNVFAWGGLFLILFTAFIILTVSFTPLREFIPGYADVQTKRIATSTAYRVDSLGQALNNNIKYLSTLKVILSGGVVKRDSAIFGDAPISNDQLKTVVSLEDSVLRNEVEQEERFNLSFSSGSGEDDGLRNILFFTPLEGTLSSKFDPTIRHYGVDIVSAESDAPIKAVLEGTVTLATWTSDEGHVIYLQHKYNLISVYKHNSMLLKKVGDKVGVGEAIAIVGSSGELSTGPHLHLELWHNGDAISPSDYIIF